MKLKKIYLFVFSLICVIYSCNTEEEIYTDYYLSSSTLVKNFSLKGTTKDTLLYPLDSVFFTIDLRNKVIFNADSLPYGSHLVEGIPSLTVVNASQVTIRSIVVKDGKEDTTTVNYLESPESVIPLVNSKIIMEVVAANGTSKEEYQIKVNVHQVKADSLFWGDMAVATLPVSGKSKVVSFKGKYYCLGAENNTYQMYQCESLSGLNFQPISYSGITGTPDVYSLLAGENSLYILDTTGQLYTSTNATTWTSVSGVQFYSLMGMYQTQLLGVTSTGGNYKFDIYPRPAGFTPYAVPSEKYFPVSGFSNTCSYSNKWGLNALMLFGGKNSNGEMTNALWAYDPNAMAWAILNNVDLTSVASEQFAISPREGAMLFPYYQLDISTSNGLISEIPAFYVIGGRGVGSNQGYAYYKDVYISKDYGVSWAKAPKSLQLPDAIAPRAYASVQIGNEPRTRSFSSNWKSINTVQPDITPVMQLRSMTETPYIYMFGGISYNGDPINNIWKGVIRQLTFAPIP